MNLLALHNSYYVVTRKDISDLLIVMIDTLLASIHLPLPLFWNAQFESHIAFNEKGLTGAFDSRYYESKNS